MEVLPLTLEIFTQSCLELGADITWKLLEACQAEAVSLPVAPGNVNSARNTVLPK